jgi:hypothetical protein
MIVEKKILLRKFV